LSRCRNAGKEPQPFRVLGSRGAMSEHIMDEKSVEQHYGRGDLFERILAGLQAAGKSIDPIRLDDLGPVDNFHTRGTAATQELMERAGIKAGMHVLDVGGGLGGTARFLASKVGCQVTVLDLTEEFCRTGKLLTERAGLSGQIDFRHDSALDIPFPDSHFDLVWMQHSAMNIADKERMYSEIYRVLRPGGQLAFHEVMAGEVFPIHFPAPWAREQTISYLRSPEAIRTLLKDTGFVEVDWLDETAICAAWFDQYAAGILANPFPPVGLHLILGNDYPAIFQNHMRSLAEHRIAVIQAVFLRPQP